MRQLIVIENGMHAAGTNLSKQAKIKQVKIRQVNIRHVKIRQVKIRQVKIKQMPRFLENCTSNIID